MCKSKAITTTITITYFAIRPAPGDTVLNWNQNQDHRNPQKRRQMTNEWQTPNYGRTAVKHRANGRADGRLSGNSLFVVIVVVVPLLLGWSGLPVWRCIAPQFTLENGKENVMTFIFFFFLSVLLNTRTLILN